MEIEREYDATATIYLINESSEVVRSSSRLNYVLNPGDTVIHTENSLMAARPSINEYFLPFTEHRDTFKYETDQGCKYRQLEYDIKNYDNKKEVGDLEFEFTFRFTDEAARDGFPCE